MGLDNSGDGQQGNGGNTPPENGDGNNEQYFKEELQALGRHTSQLEDAIFNLDYHPKEGHNVLEILSNIANAPLSSPNYVFTPAEEENFRHVFCTPKSLLEIQNEPEEKKESAVHLASAVRVADFFLPLPTTARLTLLTPEAQTAMQAYMAEKHLRLGIGFPEVKLDNTHKMEWNLVYMDQLDQVSPIPAEQLEQSGQSKIDDRYKGFVQLTPRTQMAVLKIDPRGFQSAPQAPGQHP